MEKDDIKKARNSLRTKFEKLDDKRQVLRDPELRALYDQIKLVDKNKRAEFGSLVNQLKEEVESWISETKVNSVELPPIDITAPFDINQSQKPTLLTADQGTLHPLMKELEIITDIYQRMGFEVMESREIDDDYHMFESLNFPEGHPARDDYDTFMTPEGYIAPAHTSVMQKRALIQRKDR